MNTTTYTRHSKNIYFYTRANGKKTYRARKRVNNEWRSFSSAKLTDVKNWLSEMNNY